MAINILPSIFAGNFADTASTMKQITQAGITMIHFDIMDNHFVPNLSFGPLFVEHIMQSYPNIKADIHLMIELPGNWERYLELKPESLTIHYEAGSKELVYSILKKIQDCNIKAGLSLKPSTPISVAEEFLPVMDLLLIMSVEPGFSLQPFIPESLDRIKKARELFGSRLIIEADGGITRQNIHQLKQAGLDWFVMGGGFFKDPAPETLFCELL
ncbi:MAG: ribulose-phosphate 3-epimerase [Brevinemataceae bacterium]